MKCIGEYIGCWQECTRGIKVLTRKANTFDLQLFAGEKTEEATPKRKEEARKKGQIARSVEVNSAFAIITAFFALKLVGANIYQDMVGLMRDIFANMMIADFNIQYIQTLLLKVGLVFFKMILPIMVPIVVASLAANFVQGGFVFSLEPLNFQLNRLNPLSGLQRMFSKRAVVELFKSLAKVFIISYFTYQYISREAGQIPGLSQGDLRESLQVVFSLIFDLAFRIGGIILVLAVIDYFYQSWEHKQSLKMSKQDIKDEYKQTEGNPAVKGKIKERQRAMAMRRMMHEVPKADVVITNPTHLAIALCYRKEVTAPLVVAKGQDYVAERIKKIARENQVVVVENKPLARALYTSTEIGDLIPPDLYKAVAEVLAYVYRLKKRYS